MGGARIEPQVSLVRRKTRQSPNGSKRISQPGGVDTRKCGTDESAPMEVATYLDPHPVGLGAFCSHSLGVLKDGNDSHDNKKDSSLSLSSSSSLNSSSSSAFPSHYSFRVSNTVLMEQDEFPTLSLVS